MLVAFAAAGTASASNMGFKLNKAISSQGSGTKGRNLVSLPSNNPYKGSGGLQNLCNACGLGPSGQLIQFDGLGQVYSYVCSQVQTFNLLPEKGVMITNPTDSSCILVGSDDPSSTNVINDLGQSPRGTELFNVKWHTTSSNPEQLCMDCALSNTATVTRFDAVNGQVFSHQCGQVALWQLVLGEAVLILEDNGPKTCHQSHF